MAERRNGRLPPSRQRPRQQVEQLPLFDPPPRPRPIEPRRVPLGMLSIANTEASVGRLRAKIEQLKHEAACFEEGAPEFESALARLLAAETGLTTEARLLTWMRRRLRLFRGLHAEDCMSPPRIVD